MKNFELKNVGLIDLNQSDKISIDGGIIPLLIYGGWALMGACCAVTTSLYYGYHNNK